MNTKKYILFIVMLLAGLLLTGCSGRAQSDIQPDNKLRQNAGYDWPEYQNYRAEAYGSPVY